MLLIQRIIDRVYNWNEFYIIYILARKMIIYFLRFENISPTVQDKALSRFAENLPSIELVLEAVYFAKSKEKSNYKSIFKYIFKVKCNSRLSLKKMRFTFNYLALA